MDTAARHGWVVGATGPKVPARLVAVDETSRLALAAGQGDRAALASFVQRTQGEVWRLCAALSDRTSADDLTQETYLRVMGALPSFRGDSSARTWLLADRPPHLCRRRAPPEPRHAGLVRRVRAETRRRPSRPTPRAGWSSTLLVAELDEGRREAFVLTQVLGLDYAEAAEVCDCPIGTIRSRVARARADLAGARGAARRGRGRLALVSVSEPAR